MAAYVLVHGAWHGRWCWEKVLPLLRAAGHRVHAPTLTGLAERKHLLSAQVTLETHISDIVNVIEHNDLRDVVLVAHSYGGVVGMSVAERCYKRIKHLIWVDAHMPHSGEGWGDLIPAESRAAREQEANEQGLGIALPVPNPTAWGIYPDQDKALYDWVKARLTPHPFATLNARARFDEVKVNALPRTYISCEQPLLASVNKSRDRAKAAQHAGAWRVEVMATGHDPMLTMPQEFAKILLSAA